MAQIIARFPIVEVDNYLVAVVLGSPDAAFGDEVSLEDAHSRRRYESLFVAGVDTLPASAVAPEVLDLLAAPSPEEFVRRLSRVYGTSLPLAVPVTLYTLYDRPVEEDAGDPDAIPADATIWTGEAR
jgi:hypothetical protein